MAEALNVIVLADWQRCYRQQFWQDVLDLINQRSLAPPVVCRVYRLADELAIATSQRSAPDSSCTCEANLSEYAESSFVEELQKCQVLIVNWDAVNGDPDFGADITLRWFEVRRPEIWDWVEEKGGILLIEGQAIYSVPTQRAYDSLLGTREVVVSPPEDELQPRTQLRRSGRTCWFTAAARQSLPFRNWQSITSRKSHELDELFPNEARRRLTKFLQSGDWGALYRGWFRKKLITSSRFPWVTLLKTSRYVWAAPTMLVARHGKGAVFVSTMFLASSAQIELIEAILKCFGQTDSLPSPSQRAHALRQGLREHILPILAGLAAGLIPAAQLGPAVSDLIKALIVVLAIGLVWLIAILYRALRRFMRQTITW